MVKAGVNYTESMKRLRTRGAGLAIDRDSFSPVLGSWALELACREERLTVR